jgi:hypothetical protein
MFINNKNNNTDINEELKEKDQKLQKEILNNKRLKNQVDKLSQQISTLQYSFNSYSEGMLKSKKKLLINN